MTEELKPAPVTMEDSSVSGYEAELALDRLRAEQNVVNCAAAGIIASVVGAVIWAVVTIMTEYQIGWMAVGIGLLVGFAVRFAGKGIDQVFGIIGAVLSIVGCALGNILSITFFIAVNEGMPFPDLLSQLNAEIILELLVSTFEVMDVLFYALAVYFGYRYAFRQISEDDISRALGKSL